MTIRIEHDAASDLASVNQWVTRHRGEVIALDESKRLALGTPISGARSVMIAAVLQDDARPGPQLGGVVRALSNRVDSDPVRLVFEGRSPVGLPREEAEAVAGEVLARISGLVLDDVPMAEVA